MPINPRDKGARGERQWRDMLRDKHNCTDAIRGCQNSGGPDSPDVLHGIPGTHAEVKLRKRMVTIYDMVEQAVRDAGEGVTPYVALKGNYKPWLWIVRDDDMLALARKIVEQHSAQNHG